MKISSNLKNWTIQVVSSFPTNPAINTLVLLLNDKRIYQYNGSTWNKLVFSTDIINNLLPAASPLNAGKIIKVDNSGHWTFVGIGGEIIDNLPLSFVPRSFTRVTFGQFVENAISHTGNEWTIYGESNGLFRWIKRGAILSISEMPGQPSTGTIIGTITSDITKTTGKNGFSGNAYTFTMSFSETGDIQTNTQTRIVVSAPWLLPDDSLTTFEIKSILGVLNNTGKVLGVKGTAFITDSVKRLLSDSIPGEVGQLLKKKSNADFDVEYGLTDKKFIPGYSLNTTEGDIINILGFKDEVILTEELNNLDSITTHLTDYLLNSQLTTVTGGSSSSIASSDYAYNLLGGLSNRALPLVRSENANKYARVKKTGGSYNDYFEFGDPPSQPDKIFALMGIYRDGSSNNGIICYSFDNGASFKYRQFATRNNISDAWGDIVDRDQTWFGLVNSRFTVNSFYRFFSQNITNTSFAQPIINSVSTGTILSFKVAVKDLVFYVTIDAGTGSEVWRFARSSTSVGYTATRIRTSDRYKFRLLGAWGIDNVYIYYIWQNSTRDISFTTNASASSPSWIFDSDVSILSRDAIISKNSFSGHMERDNAWKSVKMIGPNEWYSMSGYAADVGAPYQDVEPNVLKFSSDKGRNWVVFSKPYIDTYSRTKRKYIGTSLSNVTDRKWISLGVFPRVA